MTDSDFERQYKLEATLDDIQRTLALARIRCLSFGDLLQRLRKIGNGPGSEEVIYAVIEFGRSDAENRGLAKVLRELKGKADEARSEDRRWLDRQIGRILRYVPQEHGYPLIQEYLDDHRKTRRDAGFRSLRLTSANKDITEALVHRFRQTDDQRFLKVLLRQPLTLDAIDPSWLVDQLSEEYWQMRAVESALLSDGSIASTFAEKAPKLYVWASGRIGEPSAVPMIQECYRKANDKLELAGIVAWAYGKLGALDELERLEAEISESCPDDGRFRPYKHMI